MDNIFDKHDNMHFFLEMYLQEEHMKLAAFLPMVVEKHLLELGHIKIFRYMEQNIGKKLMRTDFYSQYWGVTREETKGFLDQYLPVLQSWLQDHPGYRLEVVNETRGTSYTLLGF